MAIVQELNVQAGSPEYVIQQGIVLVDCATRTQYPPLRLLFDGRWISITQDHYIWDVQNDGQYCIMLMMPNSYEFALMGQPFFHGYYTHHHMEENFIAFGPLTVNGAARLVAGTVPTRSLPSWSSGLSTAATGAAMVYLVVCMVIFSYFVAPELEKRYDLNNEADQQTYTTIVMVYLAICGAIFAFMVGPLIGLSLG